MRKVTSLACGLLAGAVVLALQSMSGACPVPLGYVAAAGGGTPAYGIDPQSSFVFSSPDLLVSGFGVLDFGLVGGSEIATSGSITVTSPDFSETLPLLSSPNAPGLSLSPSGLFIYDDKLTGTNPAITNGGLLFSALPTPNFEINIFSNGPDSYTYYEGLAGVGYPFSDNITFNGAAIPLPMSVWAGLGLVGSIGAFRLMRKQTESAFA